MLTSHSLHKDAIDWFQLTDLHEVPPQADVVDLRLHVARVAKVLWKVNGETAHRAESGDAGDHTYNTFSCKN